VKHFEAISIDLDDTLWPITPVIRRAEKRVRKWLRHHCPRVELDVETSRFAVMRQEVLRRHPDRSHDFAFQRRAALTMLLENAGYDFSTAETAYQVFSSARNEVQLYADVIPALEQLSERFILLAVTNGSADLEHIGLSELFDYSIRAADVGVGKPEAAIFAAAAAAAGVSRARVLHVGDAPLEDITGAQDAGMSAVWMNRFGRTWPQEHPPPMAEIESLDELHQHL